MLTLAAGALAFAGWSLSGSYDAGHAEEVRGALAIVAACLVAVLAAIALFRDHAPTYIALASGMVVLGAAAYLGAFN